MNVDPARFFPNRILSATKRQSAVFVFSFDFIFFHFSDVKAAGSGADIALSVNIFPPFGASLPSSSFHVDREVIVSDMDLNVLLS